MKQPAVYIVANRREGTIYVGVTSNLIKRIYEHKNKAIPGFTTRYNCTMLVYFEQAETMEQAILCEKQIKAGTRKRKIELIESANPTWRDLYLDILE